MANLLQGFIAKTVASAAQAAGVTLPGTLIRVAAGTRTAGTVTAGTNPTSTSYAVQAIPVDTRTLMRDGTLITGVDRAIRILGATLPSGVVPIPGDRITLEGTTSTIVAEGVSRDAASATYLCQCRS
ncbi:MAG TPA: hypothetical protein VFT22_07310 [Kofleriaceae bacterium]|nr:hypothetical protein [Kofleriaceae bacterium]